MRPIVPSVSTSRIPCTAASAVMPPPMMRYLKLGMGEGALCRVNVQLVRLPQPKRSRFMSALRELSAVSTSASINAVNRRDFPESLDHQESALRLPDQDPHNPPGPKRLSCRE